MNKNENKESIPYFPTLDDNGRNLKPNFLSTLLATIILFSTSIGGAEFCDPLPAPNGAVIVVSNEENL